MTTTGITKRPAQVRMALERGVVYLVLGVVFAGGTVMLAGARAPRYVNDPSLPRVWQEQGTGEDITTVADVTKGAWLAGWEAECPATVTLAGWDGERRTSKMLLGESRRGTVEVDLATGGYFFDVVADCDWTVRLSPT